ncbi:MAG: zinc-binding dehydrogenase [Propionibacteriaceae bacterium]|nr:zinc-binding dehydrogenase [Propionibacteriaceae bacterium]
MKTLAAVFEEVGKRLEIEELELDPPSSGEVLVKLKATGLCRSDYHVMAGDWRSHGPLVLGHEGAGVVEAVGSGVTSLQIGDHVILSWSPACGRCLQCLVGRPALCHAIQETAYRNLMADGTTRLHRDDVDVHAFCGCGTFATHAVVAQSAAIKVAKDIPFDIAALVGCAVATGIGAVWNTAKVAPGDSVLVVGCGGVGWAAIAAARVAGAMVIVAADPNPKALEAAEEAGATHTVQIGEGDVRDEIRRITELQGVDYAFDTIGRQDAIRLGFETLRPGGSLVCVGMPKDGTQLGVDVLELIRQEKTIMGSWYGSCQPALDFPRILKANQTGMIQLSGLVGNSISLDQINAGFDLMASGTVGRTVIALD